MIFKVMIVAGVAEVKAKLSEYLSRVRGGSDVLITEHGRPVARIVPVAGGGECLSALRGGERDGALDPTGTRQSVALLDALVGAWSEVLPSESVRGEAERALAVHPLRSADALQLGAALTWRRSPTRRAEL